MLSSNEIKQILGREAAGLVTDQSVIGIGSGSTIRYFIEALGNRVREGMSCLAVPTSSQTRQLAAEHGIRTTDLNDVSSIHLAVDGADEIDHQLRLIKGGGGALLQEKMVAAASAQRVMIADHSKLKTILGSFPLPVEVVPYGWKQVQQCIREQYAITAALRMHNQEVFITDHGHYILDCPFETIPDPAALNIALHLLPGVVETGLFINLCELALIGFPDGRIQTIRKKN